MVDNVEKRRKKNYLWTEKRPTELKDTRRSSAYGFKAFTPAKRLAFQDDGKSPLVDYSDKLKKKKFVMRGMSGESINFNRNNNRSSFSGIRLIGNSDLKYY